MTAKQHREAVRASVRKTKRSNETSLPRSKPVAWKRPLCWLERHHWLLQFEVPQTLYADNMEVRDSVYWYECQRCGKYTRTNIINLDNAPTKDPSGREAS